MIQERREARAMQRLIDKVLYAVLFAIEPTLNRLGWHYSNDNASA